MHSFIDTLSCSLCPLYSPLNHSTSRVSEGGGSTLMERKKSRDIIGLSSLRLTKCGGKERETPYHSYDKGSPLSLFFCSLVCVGKSKIDGDTILHSAVSYGYVDDTYVLDLLAKGVDVSTIVNCDGETPLHYACYYCYYFGIQGKLQDKTCLLPFILRFWLYAPLLLTISHPPCLLTIFKNPNSLVGSRLFYGH